MRVDCLCFWSWAIQLVFVGLSCWFVVLTTTDNSVDFTAAPCVVTEATVVTVTNTHNYEDCFTYNPNDSMYHSTAPYYTDDICCSEQTLNYKLKASLLCEGTPDIRLCGVNAHTICCKSVGGPCIVDYVGQPECGSWYVLTPDEFGNFSIPGSNVTAYINLGEGMGYYRSPINHTFASQAFMILSIILLIVLSLFTIARCCNCQSIQSPPRRRYVQLV